MLNRIALISVAPSITTRRLLGRRRRWQRFCTRGSSLSGRSWSTLSAAAVVAFVLLFGVERPVSGTEASERQPSDGQAADGTQANEQVPGPTAISEREVSFVRDVAPALVQRCAGCHGKRLAESSYRLDTFDGLVAMGDFGEAVCRSGGARGESALAAIDVG